MNNVELVILITVILLIVLAVLPMLMKYNNHTPEPMEYFTAVQKMNVKNVPDQPGSGINDITGVDPTANINMNSSLIPQNYKKNNESLIYDNVTNTIMTGSQFMDNTGIVAPPWIAPAWNPNAYGPFSKDEVNPADFENDPRMLYNKCSLSCCSPQYPTPFLGDSDPFVCDKNGDNKYLSSNYVCQNNTGGSGCLCMTSKQIQGMQTGFVDHNN